MPYFDSNHGFTGGYLPWKGELVKDVVWSPNKSEARKKFSDPREFEKKRLNTVKPIKTNHRIDMFYSRPNKGFESTIIAAPSPPTANKKEATSPDIQSSAVQLSRKQRAAQHYNEVAFLQRRQYHRSQERSLEVEKNDWLTTNSQELAPRPYISGLERCSWKPEDKDWHHSFTFDVNKKMKKANTEYRCNHNEAALVDSDDEESEEEDGMNSVLFPGKQHIASTPSSSLRPVSGNKSISRVSSSSSKSDAKATTTGSNLGIQEKLLRKHIKRHNHTKKRIWKLRRDMWKKGTPSGSTQRDSYKTYPERLRKIEPATRIRSQLKFTGNFQDTTENRSNFKPIRPEALAFRASYRGQVPQDAPYDRLSTVNRWPGRSNIFEFLDTKPNLSKSKTILLPPSKKQNAFNRRKHVEKIAREINAGSLRKKHPIGAFNR